MLCTGTKPEKTTDKLNLHGFLQSYLTDNSSRAELRSGATLIFQGTVAPARRIKKCELR